MLHVCPGPQAVPPAQQGAPVGAHVQYVSNGVLISPQLCPDGQLPTLHMPPVCPHGVVPSGTQPQPPIIDNRPHCSPAGHVPLQIG
jgi:hypothetical protein